MKIRAAVLLSMLMMCILLAEAQELRAVSQIRIPLGPGAREVGVERAEGEFWAPLFFALDHEGRVHVADFYKGRVAVFGADGVFVRGVPTPKGVVPSMNYFGRVAETGDYVTVARQTLYLLNEGGSTRWSSDLGGVPTVVFPARDALFVLLPPAGVLVYAYTSSQPLGTFGLLRAEGKIPLIRADTGQVFGLQAGNMRLLPDIGDNSFAFAAEAWLAGVDSDGSSLWRESLDSGERWILADRAGRLLRTGTTVHGEGMPGSGFWSFVSESLQISKATYSVDAMVVTTYGIR